MTIVPCPPEDAAPFNKPESATLDGGQKATFTYEPEQRLTTFFLPMLGISKHPDSTYEVKIDGQTLFGPAAVPPTDIDDMVACWLPAISFDDEMKVVVRNLSASTTRRYVAQPIGWEVSE